MHAAGVPAFGPPVALAPVLRAGDGRVWADSRDIAAQLGRRHHDVLRAWRDLDCPDDFRQSNFAVAERPGGDLSHVTMNRDGCVFLISRLTGAKAAGYLIAYIAEFRRMKDALKAAAVRPVATAAPPAALDYEALCGAMARATASVTTGPGPAPSQVGPGR
ncbi:Rha family transcriptional regulator [Paracraurococcus lichenis]|uniref:Rha family transcriptional regulator n=1 Tax=Paracraurococcus lichenis TaxID=3064888 RepID=A0ABT9EC51_9PROT|nr:Rha family transcriptional regulator [Paracraurococcus sp. LOR1-02]MDO9713764.1 Rha family transcriptional regulator [Paracraurococcus sp. LOR1-02]